MFLALLGERPRPTRTPKNLQAGGTGSVHTDTKLTQGLEIPMAVADARKRFSQIAVGVLGPTRATPLDGLGPNRRAARSTRDRERNVTLA